MTEYNQPPGGFRDTWVDPNRPSLNLGSTSNLRLVNDGTRTYVRVWLPNMAGRTVLEATLTAHVWRDTTWTAQTVTAWRCNETWAEGRITSNNQPTVNFGDEVSVLTGALDPGDRIEWDVTAHMQAVADGAEWHGWRISTDAGGTQRLASTESGLPHWELHIVLSDSPDVPSNLRPDAGAVETSTPVLAWDFVDLGGESTTQAQSRIQVDTPADGADPDDVAPDFDTGWFANLDFHYDLATSAHVPATTATLETYWRVNVQDADGNESGWSDWASYTADPKPALAIDSPTGTFGDPTPAILAHLTTGSVESWRIHVTGPDRSDIRARSGRRPGSEPIDWTVPLRVDGRRVIREGEVGWANVRVYPVGDRAVAVGEHTYVDAWIPLDLDTDLALAAPTNLSVTQVGRKDPRQVWQWDRTEAADAWLIQVDGLTIARLTPEDLGGQVHLFGPERFDSDISGWTGSLGASVSHSTADGGLLLLAGDGGFDQVDSPAFPVTAGDPVTASAWVQSMTTARDAAVGLVWITGAGETVDVPASVATSTTGRTKLTHTTTAPAGATSARLRVRFQSTVAGDEFTVDDAEVTSGAGYMWTDNGEVPPMRPHTLAVRAIEAGSKRSAAAEVEQAHIVEGVWLLPLGDGVPVVLDGTAVEGFAATDARATYEMQDGSEHDIIYGHVPRKGEFSGTVGDHTLGGTWAALDQIETWKRATQRNVRMVWGSQSELVRLRDPDATSADDMLPNNELHVVRYSFICED